MTSKSIFSKIVSIILSALLATNLMMPAMAADGGTDGEGQNNSSGWPAAVTTTMTDGSTGSLDCITATHYFEKSDGTNTTNPFVLELKNFNSTSETYTVILSTQSYDNQDGSKIELTSVHQDGSDTYFNSDDISALLTNSSANLYVTLLNGSDVLYYTTDPIAITYVPDNIATVEYGSYVNATQLRLSMDLSLPGSFSPENSYTVKLLDQSGTVAATTVNDQDMSYMVVNKYTRADDRYGNVFDSDWLNINRDECRVDTTLYCTKQLTAGNYNLQVTEGSNDPVTYNNLVKVVNDPVVQSCYADTNGYPAAVAGGDTVYIDVNADGATGDNLKVGLTDSDNNPLATTSSLRYEGENDFIYKVKLTSATFIANKEYHITLASTSGLQIYYPYGVVDGVSSFYVSEFFDVYTLQYNGARNLADYTLKAINPPDGTITVGLFKSNSEVDTPIATTTVTPSSSMTVTFKTASGQTMVLPSGDYNLRYLAGNTWQYLGAAYVYVYNENDIYTNGFDFYKTTDNTYQFDVSLPKSVYNLTDSSTYAVSLVDSKEKTVGTLSGNIASVADQVNVDGNPVPVVCLSGTLDLTADAKSEGSYQLVVEITNGTDKATATTYIGCLNPQKIYATGNIDLCSDGIKATLYNPQVDNGYDANKFAYKITDLNDRTKTISATVESNQVYQDGSGYISFSNVFTEKMTPGYYQLELQYDGKDIYNTYNPTEKLFSGYSLYNYASVNPSVKSYYLNDSALYGVLVDEGTYTNPTITALLYDPSDSSKFDATEVTLVKDAVTGLYEFSDLSGINTALNYKVVFMFGKVCIGSYYDETLISINDIQPVAVDSVSISAASTTLKVGETYQLSKTISPADASNQSVIWSSGDQNVATVGSNGLVTAVGKGTATITVTTADGGKTAQCVVTVEANIATLALDSMQYSDTSAVTATSGVYAVDGAKFTAQTAPLTLVVKGDGYDPQKSDYSISMTNGSTVVYSDSAVSGQTLKDGYSFSLQRAATQTDGSYSYSIVIKDGTSQVAALALNVTVSNTPVLVTGISLNKSAVTVNVGSTTALTATVLPSNATNKTVNWSSDNENAATVSQSGVVSAVGTGTAVITAATQDGSYKANCTVNVGVTISGKLFCGGDACTYTWISLYNSQGNYVSGKNTGIDGGFSFAGIPVGDYTLQAYAPEYGYQNLKASVTIEKGDTVKDVGNISFDSKYANTTSLGVTVSGATGAYQIYVYSPDTQYNNYKSINSNTTTTFDNIPYGSNTKCYVSLYDYNTGYYGQKTITLGANNSITFDIPASYTISGTVKDEDGAAITWQTVVASSETNTYYGYTDANGSYSIKGLPPGNYTVGMYPYSNYQAVNQNVTITNNNMTADLIANKGMTISGTVEKTDGTSPYRAYLTLYDKDNKPVCYATAAGKSGFVMDGAVKTPGDYTLKVEYIYSENYTSQSFVGGSVSLTVTQDDINSSKMVLGSPVTYSDPTSISDIFKGTGNLVVTDVNIVHTDSIVNLVIKYQNNGNTSVDSAKFTAQLPSGVTAVNGNDTFTVSNLAAGQAGQQTITVKIGTVDSNFINIPVSVRIGESTYDFGTASLEFANITLSGTNAVDTSTSFKVYGEATAGSTIIIKNAETGAVLASATPSGRWYSAEISLTDAGTYQLVAEATAGGVTAKSDVLTVDAKDNQISVLKVKRDNSALSLNKRIGVYTFSTYANSELNGFDFSLSVAFKNGSNITSVVYNFSDLKYEAQKTVDGDWYANLSGWKGAGLKTITATVKTSDGKTLTFIIAEVTVLIDPSGVITDAETGAPLAGATVVCQVDNGGNWENWDAESYGQSNPMTSDSNGCYGWMVPAGTYRILAYKDGYQTYDTTLDTKNTNNNSIIIPPPRTDVNFEMEPSVRVTSVSLNKTTLSLTVGGSESLTATVSPDNATNAGNMSWISDKTSVATVSATGSVTAVSAGTATITVKCGTQTATCTVTVTSSGSGGGGISTTTTSNQSLVLSADKNGAATVTAGNLKTAEKLTVKADVTLNFDKTAINTLTAAGGDVSISVTKADTANLSKEALDAIGSRPVYSITATAGGTAVSDFKGGKVSVEIPYTLQPGEDANALVVYYMDAEGNLNVVSNGYYDVDTQTIKVTVTHFSMYAIGYHKVIFNDVASSAWYSNAVEFIAARGITTGTGDGNFLPDDTLTRGQFIVMLLKSYGISADQNPSTNFNDAGSTYYTNYLATAKRLGIAQGVGDNNFAPNSNISRQDMFTLLYRALNVLNQVPDATTGKTTTEFKDAGQIAEYAATAMDTFVKCGIIHGSDGNLAPRATTTRAEMAQVLCNLLSM